MAFHPDQFGDTIAYIKRQFELEKGDLTKISGKFQKAKDADAGLRNWPTRARTPSAI
jgi:hypothetical protein